MELPSELLAAKWKKQAECIPVSPIRLGLEETIDLLRVNMLALQLLEKELPRDQDSPRK